MEKKSHLVGSRIEKQGEEGDAVWLILYLASQETRDSFYRETDMLTQAFNENPQVFDERLDISFANQAFASQFFRLQAERMMGTKIVTR